MKKRKQGIIDYKAIERGSSMGKYDIFQAGRKEASRISKKYSKQRGVKPIKWTI